MTVLLVDDCYVPPLVGRYDMRVQVHAYDLVLRPHDVFPVATEAEPGGWRAESNGDTPVHRSAGHTPRPSGFSEDPQRTRHPTRDSSLRKELASHRSRCPEHT